MLAAVKDKPFGGPSNGGHPLLGFQFALRIPDLKSQRLCSFGKATDYPSLEPLIAGRINTALIRAPLAGDPAGPRADLVHGLSSLIDLAAAGTLHRDSHRLSPRGGD